MPRDFTPEDFASSRGTVEMLRREISGHNLRVILLSVLCALAAVLLWAALYAIAYWLTLLLVTAVRGVDATPPAAFRPVFCSAAAGLLVFAAVDRILRPDDRPRDHRTAGEYALDFILAVPRVTLAVWSTLSTRLHLTPLELAQAAAFLDRLGQNRRILLQSVPLEIPDDRARERILFALQLLQIIDVRRHERDFWVTLNALRPAAFREPAEG
jgi:hypothetical protein